jgi:two-component system, NarL family, response regulator NreC
MATPITIVLVDDHVVVRHGLRALLTGEADFAVVGEASEGRAGIELVERLQPDVLIVDIMMPGLNGLEVARQVSRRCQHTRVLVLSMYANEAYVLQALRYGAIGYVLKESSAEVLLEAVRFVAAGRRYLCPPLSERAIEAYMERSEPAEPDVYESLTSREREILQLLAEGSSNAQIAAQLFISARTVENHRANIMQKLGLHSHTDLIRFAFQRGILSTEG